MKLNKENQERLIKEGVEEAINLSQKFDNPKDAEEFIEFATNSVIKVAKMDSDDALKFLKSAVKERLMELWYNDNIDDLRIKWAETGADREMDFDEEREMLKEYSRFLRKLNEERSNK